MKNQFYAHWQREHNVPTLDEKIEAAGIKFTADEPSTFQLEHTLITMLGYDAAVEIIRTCWRDAGLEVIAKARLQAAIKRASRAEDSDAAILEEFPSEQDEDYLDPRADNFGIQ